MKLKLLLFFLLAAMVTCTIVSISSANNTMVFSISMDVIELDPGNTVYSQAVDNIFEGLVKFKAGTTSIEPCLANSWKISEDGKEIIFPS